MKRWSLALAFLVCGLVSGAFFAGPWLHGQTAGEPVKTNIPKEFASYSDVVKRVLPAVVSIEAQAKVAQRTKLKSKTPARPQLPDGVPEEFRRFFEDHGRAPFDRHAENVCLFKSKMC